MTDSDIDSVRMEISDLRNTASRNSSSLTAQLNSLDSRFNTVTNQVTSLEQMTDSVMTEISDLRNNARRNSSSLTAQLNGLDSRFSADLVTVTNQITSLEQISSQ